MSSDPKWIAVIALVPREEKDQIKLSEHTRHISRLVEKPSAEDLDELVRMFVDHNFWGVFS